MLALSTRIKRLTMFAVMLERIASNSKRRVGFNLRVWGSRDEVIREISDRPECGMAQCAGGFAASYRPFRKLGLRAQPGTGAPIFRDGYGMSAMSKFLGLEPGSATHFFSPQHYAANELADPLAVARRIRAYLVDLKNPRRRDTRVA